eukprot:251839_1
MSLLTAQKVLVFLCIIFICCTFFLIYDIQLINVDEYIPISIDNYKGLGSNISTCSNIVLSKTKYSIFDKYFFEIGINDKVIHKKQQYIDSIIHSNCICLDDKINIFNHKQNTKNRRIAVLSANIHSNKSKKHINVSVNSFNDYRMEIMRICNFLEFSLLNDYTFIYLTDYLRTTNKKQTNVVYQKIFLISKFLHQFDWIIWIDFDSFIYNIYDNNMVAINWLNNILMDIQKDSQVDINQSISMIYSHDEESTLNAGFLIIKNDVFGQLVVKNWLFVQNVMCSLYTFNYHEQSILSAIIQGFNISYNKCNDINKYAKYCDRNYIIKYVEMFKNIDNSSNYYHSNNEWDRYIKLNKTNFYDKVKYLVFDKYYSKHCFMIPTKYNP